MSRQSTLSHTILLTSRLILATTGGLALYGCGAANVHVPTAIVGPALHGVVHGGQQPVVGSTIQLYAVGSGGYGSASTSLLSGAITTDSNGSFNITGNYSCPAASTPVYLTASGGNSGFASNPNLSMMVALGPCGNLTAATNVFVDEVTTVASVWALSPFMVSATAIGTTLSNSQGLANAFDDVNTLADSSLGTSPGPGTPSGASVPTSKINTLADILGTCINSGGGTAGDGSACGNLFNATKVAGVPPSNTISAALNIAQHPAGSVAALFGLVSGQAPFQPTLPAAPNDFTIAVIFTQGVSSPVALAADSTGNIWLVNQTNATAAKLTHTGALLVAYTGTLNSPSAVAVDASGNAWIANQGNSTVTRLTGGGSAIGLPLTGGGLNTPRSIAFDAQGNAWITNDTAASRSLSVFNSAGTAVTGVSGYTGPSLSTPAAIAISPH
jgi:hypothetical protein